MTKMAKQLSVVCGVTATAVLSSMAVGFGVSAQNLAHGIPTPEKVYGDGVTWPIKIEIRDYDKEKILAPPALSEEEQTGRIVWLQKCAYCHDGVGAPTYRTMGPWLGAEVVTTIGEDNVRSFISEGDVRMPAFRYGLNTQQIDDVIAFLKTVRSDQKPTAAQLAGRGNTGVASD
jgi:mono/diheme cytochrome c family protein